MFPAPIVRARRPLHVAFCGAVPLPLLLWLLPLVAISLTSVRSLEDIDQGNCWGLPSDWKPWERYTAIFSRSPMARYLANIESARVEGASALQICWHVVFFAMQRHFIAGLPLGTTKG